MRRALLSYLSSDVFKLAHMEMTDGVAGRELFDIARRITPNVAYFLPRNVDQDEVRGRNSAARTLCGRC